MKKSMKYMIVMMLLLLFLFNGCVSKPEETGEPELLTFPGLDWNASIEEVEEQFPGGETRTYENVPDTAYYEVDGVSLWDDDVSLSFTYQDGYLITLDCVYEDPEIDPDAIREKVRAAYGEPYREYTWQQGLNSWRSEERMIDRVQDEETVWEIGEDLKTLQPIREERYEDYYGILQSLCENHLVSLSFDDERNILTWRPVWYSMFSHHYTEPRISGKVPLEQLMEAAEEGEKVYAEDGVLQEIRWACGEDGLEDLQDEWGDPSERFLSYDMPEGSIFWVSEEQVYDNFGKESEEDLYMSMVNAETDREEDSSYWGRVQMYRTPLVLVYWDGETEELVWDLTGQANLERVQAQLS